MKKQFTLLLVFIFAIFYSNAQIYVNASATPPGDGDSWATAYTDLQSALADGGVATEQIWVATGTYYPTSGIDRFISFNIPDGAEVYGGFDGTETSFGDRDYLTNTVILSGNINNLGSSADNSYHVVTLIDVTVATIIDGLVITAGRADRGSGMWDEDNGGGFYIVALNGNCNPIIQNCIIQGNYADYQGGGMFIWAQMSWWCDPQIINCLISNNSSLNYGGGIYIFADNGHTSPTLTSCQIRGNFSLRDGGGILTEGLWSDGSCNAVFTTCIISGNESEYGGGIAFWSSNSGSNNSVMNNCTFSGNYGNMGGGAIEYWSADTKLCDPVLNNCLFWGNSSIIENFDATAPEITYNYCDIEGSPSSAWDLNIGIDGGFNIDANPYFNVPIIPSLTTDGNFRNHFASLAIGAGDATLAPVNDIDGNPFSTPPSIGAYEYDALPGDWEGAIDSDWGTATNWMTGVVATTLDDVILSSKAINQPVISEGVATPAECKNLELTTGTSLSIEPLSALTVHGNLAIDPASNFTIASDVNDEVGSLITLGSVSGEIEMERYVGEDEWHLVSTPVIGQTAEMFLGDFLQTYNEETQIWTDIEDEFTLLDPMTGYSFWGTSAPRATTYTFLGEPGSGDFTAPFTSANTNGWNLFGNPYPSGIDWDLVVQPLEMNSAVYYFNTAGGNYVSYNGGMGGGSQYIPPMQGFWISANAPGTFALGNDVRTHLGNDNYYKNEKVLSNYIELQVQSGNMIDKTYIRLNELATAAFDGKYDAYKMMAVNKNYPQLYTIASDDKLSINQLPATDIIPIGFYVKNSGNYTISLAKMTDISSCQLEDLKTGTIQDLENGNYTFSYSEGEDGNRFRLHLTAASVNQSGAEMNIKIYAVGKEVFVKSASSIENGTLRITDLSGRTLAQENINNQNFYRLSTNLKTGVYIVTIAEPAGIKTEKIVIN